MSPPKTSAQKLRDVVRFRKIRDLNDFHSFDAAKDVDGRVAPRLIFFWWIQP